MTKVVDNYALLEVVGSGQYGNVYKARHMKTEHIYAVKCIRLEKFHKVPKLEEFTYNEIKILSKLNNPHVIKFYERLKTANNLYLVYEFCGGGTLETHIFKKKRLGEEEAMKIFKQILMAFQSLVKENILHRDLKPGNILFHGEIVKLADFGFCKGMSSHLAMTSTMVGSPIYMAPEILKGASYNTKADVWSLGVVLYEMLYGKCPFEERTIPRLLSVIQTRSVHFNHILNEVSPGTQDIIRGMLTVDATKRISWQQLFDRVLGRGGGIERPSFNAGLHEEANSGYGVYGRSNGPMTLEHEKVGDHFHHGAAGTEEGLQTQPSQGVSHGNQAKNNALNMNQPGSSQENYGSSKNGSLGGGVTAPIEPSARGRLPGTQIGLGHLDFGSYQPTHQGNAYTLPPASNIQLSNPGSTNTMVPTSAASNGSAQYPVALTTNNTAIPSTLPQGGSSISQASRFNTFPQSTPQEPHVNISFLGKLDRIMKNTSLMRELEKVASSIEERRLGSPELVSLLNNRVKVQYTLHCIDFVMEIKDEDCRDQCIAIVYMMIKQISLWWRTINEQLSALGNGKLSSYVIDDEYFADSLRREEEEFRRIEESMKEEVDKGKDGVIAALPEFGREVITEDVNPEFLLNIVVDVINNLKKQYDSEEVKYSFDFKYIILNHVCDLIVINDIGETLLDPCAPMNEQAYFDSLKRLTKHELLCLVESKISLAYKENEADEEGRPHFGEQKEEERKDRNISQNHLYGGPTGESIQHKDHGFNGYTF